MTDKLSDNDRQRIEQAAKKNMRKYYGTEANFLRDAPDSDYELKLYKDGATDATIYEREQQPTRIGIIGKADPLSVKLLNAINKIKQLEAERTELIKKIEELKFLLNYGKNYLPQGYVQFEGHFFNFKDRLEAALNSLKTK